MDGRKFFQVLLDSNSLNPHALAQKLRKPSLQSSLQRYLEGKTSEPRRSTFEPIAQFLGVAVDGFFNPDIADQELMRLGLAPGKPNNRTTQSTPKIDRSSIEQILKGLASIVAEIDPASRDDLAPILSALVMGPDSQEIIDKILNYIENAPLKKRGTPELGAHQQRQHAA